MRGTITCSDVQYIQRFELPQGLYPHPGPLPKSEGAMGLRDNLKNPVFKVLRYVQYLFIIFQQADASSRTPVRPPEC